jgi:hypothetical protein
MEDENASSSSNSRTKEIKRWRISKIPNDCVIFIIGRRGTGKTTDALEIFYKKRYEFAFGLIFCGNKATIKRYEKHFPSTFIHDEYDSELLAKFFFQQEQRVEEGTAQPVFVLIDDCLWSKRSITDDPVFIRLCNNGRHAKICLVVLFHYPMAMSSELRGEVDYAVLKHEKVPANRERLYDAFNTVFESKSDFNACLKQLTLDYGAMVLDNHSCHSEAIEENCYWQKVKNVQRKFRVNPDGSWWKYHKQKFDPKHFLKAPPPVFMTKKKRAPTAAERKKAALLKFRQV